MDKLFYKCEGVTTDDYSIAEEWVDAGKVVRVITPEEHRQEAKEAADREALRLANRALMEAAEAKALYDLTFEGQTEKALSAGSRVTVIGEEPSWPF